MANLALRMPRIETETAPPFGPRLVLDVSPEAPIFVKDRELEPSRRNEGEADNGQYGGGKDLSGDA
jgi:hypothetical protein